MQFIRFLDNVFQGSEVSIAEHKFKTGYFPTIADARGNAAQYIMTVYRFMLGVLLIPVLLVWYLLVEICILRPPLPKVDMMKAQLAADERAKNKLRKRHGFKEKDIPDRPPIPEVKHGG